MRRTRVVLGVIGLMGTSACAPRPFDRYLSEGRWVDAARVFAADSALMNDEHALWEAANLYSSPARPTYDPARARVVLTRLITRFPSSANRLGAVDRLALLNAALDARDSAAMRQRAVESQIVELTAEVQRLRTSLDSANAQRDALRRSTVRLESDLRERDEQLKALRLELKQLKEIDLKPRKPPP